MNNTSKAYRTAYYATRAVFRAFDFVADRMIDFADNTVHTGKTVVRGARDIGLGVKDAAINSVTDIPLPRPRTPIIIEGHIISGD